MSSYSYAPPWGRSLDAAADITRRILTPFFLNTTRAINAGTLPSLITHPEETMQTLGTSMPTFMGLLSNSTAWHQANSAALTSQWTLAVLKEQHLMINACFETTTAVLDGRHNIISNDIVNAKYLIILSTAFNILQSWNPVWPSEHLLENPPAIAALDRLLSRVVQISRDLSPTAKGPRKHNTERLIESAVTYSDAFLQTIRLLPVHKIPGFLAALPPTLLPNIFYLADANLLSLIRSANFTAVFEIIHSVGNFVRALIQHNLSSRGVLNAELVGLTKHLFLMCVPGKLPIPYDEPVSSDKIQALQESALQLLLFESKLDSPALSAAMRSPEDSSSSASSSSNSGGQPAHQPTVTDSEYFRVLCLCAASCAVYKANGNCIYANSLLLKMMQTWRRPGGDIVLGRPQLACVLSLLQFTTRQAQLRIQPLSKLRLQQRQQLMQVPELFAGNNLEVQMLFQNAIHILAAFTGLAMAAVAASDLHACMQAKLCILPPDLLTLQTRVLSWSQLAGSAATIEALLRDKHLRGPFNDQFNATLAGLMILGASYDRERSAMPARISLAATLRKLTHPESDSMWKAAVHDTSILTATQQIERCAEVRLSIIHTLKSTVIATLMCIPHSTAAALPAVSIKQGSLHAGVEGPARKVAASGTESSSGSSSSGSSRYSVDSVRSSSSAGSKQPPVSSFRPTYLLQLLSIAAATHVQLSVRAGHQLQATEAYTKKHPVSAVANALLQASYREHADSVSREHASLAATSWEQFASMYLSGRLLPGCSHWGCTNLEGAAEASLPTKLCSGCRRARYCCDSCQRAAWVGGHREVCGTQR